MKSKIKILISGLCSEGGGVTAVTKSIISNKILNNYVEFIPHSLERSRNSGKHGKLTLENFYYFLKHYRNWILLIIKYRPDIVHYPITSHWNAFKSLIFLSTAKLFGIKTIGHLHGGKFDEFWNSLPTIGKNILRLLMRDLDGVIVLGEKWKTFMVQKVGIPEKKIFILYNTCDSVFESFKFSPPFVNKNKTSLFN